MKVGDLVKHTILRETRQTGVITQIRLSKTYDGQLVYKVYWACLQTEEYWLRDTEVEAA